MVDTDGSESVGDEARQEYTRLAGVAATSLFCLFEAYGRSIGVNPRYPSPPVRSVVAHGFSEFARKRFPSLLDAFQEGMGQGIDVWSMAGWGDLGVPAKEEFQAISTEVLTLVDRLKRTGGSMDIAF